YHLAADAKNNRAILELRKRKRRPFKPFALMAPSIEAVSKYAYTTEAEKKLLTSKERPIVLLKIKNSEDISASAAPGLTYLGFMIPYTPFQHRLFFKNPETVLVMTSGNITDEPIIFKDGD